jgi:type III restriction enzyme
MVRTPLARQIGDNEFLNSVDLFLPQFDAANVDRIVARLTGDDYEYVPPTTVTKMSLSLVRADGTADIFEALKQLPSYLVPRRHKPKQTHRMVKMATYLARDRIDEEALETAVDNTIGVLDAQLRTARKNKEFDERITGRAVVEMGRRVFGIRNLETFDLTHELATASDRDIDLIFDQAGKRIGEGLHENYWDHLVRNADAADPAAFDEFRTAKNTIVLLLADPAVIEAVEDRAEAIVNGWFEEYHNDIDELTEDKRSRYIQVRGAVGRPTQVTNHYPTSIEVAGTDKDIKLDRHVYVTANDQTFETRLNKLEQHVIDAQLARSDVVRWLRNYERKPWALMIPYQRKNEWRSMYPDFLVFRRDGNKVTVDLIDPHTTSFEDAAAKAKGYAAYARDHFDRFGRIELIDKIDGDVRSLNMKDPKVQGLVLTVTNSEQLVGIYKAHGEFV